MRTELGYVIKIPRGRGRNDQTNFILEDITLKNHDEAKIKFE